MRHIARTKTAAEKRADDIRPTIGRSETPRIRLDTMKLHALQSSKN